MKKIIFLKDSSFVSIIILIFLVLSCANSGNRNSQSSAPIISNNSLANSNSTNQNSSDATSSLKNFAISTICSIPKEVAPNTPYENLGGGSWGKWNDSGGNLDYGCNGGKDSV
ncbi:hypothetical protein BH20ACI4_BH20ACI4_23150 [soil metagenome]